MKHVNTAFFLEDGTNILIPVPAKGVVITVGDKVTHKERSWVVVSRRIILRDEATNIHLTIKVDAE